MPFLHSRVNIPITPEQEQELKTRLGQAIILLPGKSERWLMTGFEDNVRLYFRGENLDPIAFIEVKLFGGSDTSSYDQLTAAITEIFGDVLGIAPDHIYVCYEPTNDWGWNGSNF